jgi:DHA1 family tetracycline resistance protein-like MFS transporter
MEVEQTGGEGLLARLGSEFDFVKGNFLVLVVSWVIMDLASELPSTYYPLYVEALGGSATVIGLIGFVSMIAQALVMFPGGYMADKYGRRWLVSIMTFGLAGSYAFYAFAPSWQWIMVGAVFQSLCYIYRPALEATIMDSLPAERRGMGFSLMNLIMSVSTTPSPLIAGWLFRRLGLVPSVRVGYSFVLVAFTIAGVIRLRLTETLESPRKINLGELVRSYPSSIVESIRVWSQVPGSAFVLFLSRLIMMFSLSMFQPFLVLYVVGDLGIPATNWALILTSLFVSMIALSIPVGKIVDMVGKKRPMIVSYFIWMAVVPLFIYGDFQRLLLAMILVGLLQILLMSASSALMADLVPSEHRGKVSGSAGFFILVAGSVGYLLGGYIYDNVSHQLPLWLQLAFAVPSLLLVLFFVKEPKKGEG